MVWGLHIGSQSQCLEESNTGSSGNKGVRLAFVPVNAIERWESEVDGALKSSLLVVFHRLFTVNRDPFVSTGKLTAERMAEV